jgi:membrane associated rhomboid family serine protease
MSDPILQPTQLPPQSIPYPVKRPLAWVTWTILVSTVAVFLLQLYEAHLRGDDVVGDTLAFSPQSFADHRYWTLITYAWVHAVSMFGDSGLFWLHIVANMVFLYCLGPALEDYLGPWRFLGLYLGGAVAAALFWLLFISSDSGSDQGIIGASGAIFALVAAAGTAAPRERVTLYLFYILPIKMTLRTMALLVCGLEIAQIIFGWFPEIAHTAHLGGALFGFLYILVVRFISRSRAVYG